MKSLKIIQVLAKIARIICLVVFIACIIGAAGCLIGLIIFCAIKDIPFNNGQTISSKLIEQGTNSETVIVAIIIGMASCGITIFLAKFNEIFYRNEIKEGTPFRKVVVRDMRITALVNIVVSFSFFITLAITVGIIKAFLRNIGDIRLDFSWWMIGYGVALLVISLFCDYGVELSNSNVIDTQVEEVENEPKD